MPASLSISGNIGQQNPMSTMNHRAAFIGNPAANRNTLNPSSFPHPQSQQKIDSLLANTQRNSLNMRAAVPSLRLQLSKLSHAEGPNDNTHTQKNTAAANHWQSLVAAEDFDAAIQIDSHSLFSQGGVFDADKPIPDHLKLYVEQCDDVMAKVRDKVSSGEMSPQKAVAFQTFLIKIGNEVMNHPIIAKNAYLERFREGVTPAQARNELQQFSVFAFQFNVSLAKMIANADTQEEWQTYTTILANEMGAPFAQGFDGELKGTFNIQKHNHHSWLMENAKDLGLSFKDIGSLKVAHSGTKAFVNAIDRYYTSNDRNVRGGAAFAIENWAAAKFWPLWLEGVKTMNKSLPKEDRAGLSYIKYHDVEERHHSKETIDELLDAYLDSGFEPETYLASAVTMLNEGVQAYYESQLANTPDKDETWPNSIVSK